MDAGWITEWIAYTLIAYIAYRVLSSPKPKRHTNNRGTF